MPELQQYCTLFDRNYLVRALVLYRSLERVCDRFLLRALCMDDESRELLDRLSLPHLRTIEIAQLERSDPELRGARATRSAVEYCWTCASAVCRYILRDEGGLSSITYLDADLCFWSSPDLLFTELGEGSILLVPHRNSEAYDADTGTYNVGWLTFRNDANGNEALDWWRERCIDWCYDRFEPDRYGDQKYLDDWPSRFGGVKVTANAAAGLAPWNEVHHHVTRSSDGSVLVDGERLIYFHHAGLRVHPITGRSRSLARWTRPYRVSGDLVWTVLGRPTSSVLELVWEPYVRWLSEARHQLAAVGAPPSLGLNPPSLRIALSQEARQRTPAAVLSAARRVPAPLRYRIGRMLSPS